jgi:hypothetical protein
MKQREHEALDRFAVLNKLSLPGEAAFARDMGGPRFTTFQIAGPDSCF